jgi:hypothetical protein
MTMSKCANSMNILLQIARQNAMNFSNKVNFNKYGKKSGIGLIPLTNYFIDTFILRYTVDSNDCETILNQKQSIIVKALPSCTIMCVKIVSSTSTILEFRVNAPFECFDKVMNLLRSDFMKANMFVLWCIDITQDFSGSFDLSEVLEYYELNDIISVGYKAEGKFVEYDMMTKVGHNCLIYKDKSTNIRSKIYLKLPQQLQCSRVRDDIGHQWFQWVNPKNSERKSEIEKSSSRGLTRIEITVYCHGQLSYNNMELCKLVDDARNMLPSNLIYETSHSQMWTAYIECIKHSLVVVNEAIDLALVVYSLDKTTSHLSGFKVNRWKAMETRILSLLTFSSHIPIDIIRIKGNDISEDGNGIKLETTRYKKVIRPGFLDVTYMCDKNGALKVNPNYLKSDLITAGFTDHVSCQPAILTKQRVPKSAQCCDLIAESVETCTINIKHTNKKAMNKCAPIPVQSCSDVNELDGTSQCELMQLPLMKLRSLKRGIYNIHAIIWETYPRLIVNIGNDFYGVICTKDCVQHIPHKFKNKIGNTDMSLIGTLSILYHTKGKNVHKSHIEMKFD